MGPQNAVIGNDVGVDLPVKEPDLEAITDDQRKAQYSKSKEFQVFKEMMEERIAYYKNFLPGGVAPVAIGDEERGKYWAIATEIIKEFENIIGVYGGAAERVKDGQSR